MRTLLNGPLSTEPTTKTNRLFNSIVQHPVSFSLYSHTFSLMIFFFFSSVHSQQIAQHLPFPTFIGSSAIKYKQNNENMKSMDEGS